MYFYKKNGKQFLDLTGDLFLTHNDNPVKTRGKSAAPNAIKNSTYIQLHNVGFFRKVFIMFYVAVWIWRPSLELTPEKTALNKPYIKTNNDDPNNCQCEDENGKPLNDCDNCPR